jgi:hypothetical protein
MLNLKQTLLRDIGSIQFEDTLLFLWLWIVEPFLQGLLGTSLKGLNYTDLKPGIPHDKIFGLLFVIAGVCACVSLATRTRGADDERENILGTLQGYAHFPLLAGLALVFILGLGLLGSPLPDATFPLTFLFILVVILGHKWLPQVDGLYRRLLMTPMILVSTWIFTATVDTIFSGLDLRTLLRSFGTAGFDAVSSAFWTTTLASLVFYLMFIFAPRQVTSSGGSLRDWLARFLLYMLGLLLNFGTLQLLGVF